MARLLTIEAEHICYKCEEGIRKHHGGECAFRSCGNEYCDRIEDIDLMINKLLKIDYNSDNREKTIKK